MIPKGLFAEIIMIALAVGIVFTYIKPTFTDITNTQNDIMLYQTEREKVSFVNNNLSELLSRLDSVSAEDKGRLLTYLPDQVDGIAVSRTLSFMAEEAGLILIDVTYSGVNTEISEEENNSNPIKHTFDMSIEGSYSQIKKLLSMLEENEYPLEVRALSISVLDGGFLSAELEITTYSHYEPPLSISDTLIETNQ